jgi:hypothetical protein
LPVPQPKHTEKFWNESPAFATRALCLIALWNSKQWLLADEDKQWIAGRLARQIGALKQS